MNNARVKEVLFVAGPQWGRRTAEDIVKALEVSGYVIVPKYPTDKMLCAAADDWDRPRHNSERQSYTDIWTAMVKAWTEDRS